MREDPKPGWPAACVSSGQVEEIRRLEDKLSRETGRRVVLVAYEERR